MAASIYTTLYHWDGSQYLHCSTLPGWQPVFTLHYITGMAASIYATLYHWDGSQYLHCSTLPGWQPVSKLQYCGCTKLVVFAVLWRHVIKHHTARQSLVPMLTGQGNRLSLPTAAPTDNCLTISHVIHLNGTYIHIYIYTYKRVRLTLGHTYIHTYIHMRVSLTVSQLFLALIS